LTSRRHYSIICAVAPAVAAMYRCGIVPPKADDFHITIDPSSPTDKDTFDLRAFRWFPDSGYLGIDQSISVSGNQIDVRALVQDQHTRPDSAFLTVMTPGGAFFPEFGPLAAGTYQLNTEIWLTPWPDTSGGYLCDEGNLQFTVTGVSVHETLPGDFNGDNVVNAGDYVAWRKTGDIAVGYNAWQVNFGETVGSGSAATGTVPEPATALLLLLSLASGFFSRRKL
jgi:hypothetical protein